MQKDVQYLSSDEMGGRRTGSPGAALAAAFIEKRFVALGLKPLGDSYRQVFPAMPERIDKEGTWLRLGGEESVKVPAGSNYLPHPSSPSGTAKGKVVFAGYGLQALEYEYDDLSDLDVKDRVVLLFRWEPQAQDTKSRFLGRKLLPGSHLSRKIHACQEKGAVAVLVASPPGLLEYRDARDAPGASYWPAFSATYNQIMPTIRNIVDQEELQETNFTAEDAANQFYMELQFDWPLGTRIPVAYVSTRVVEEVFQAADRDPAAWVKEVDASGAADSFSTDLEVSLSIKRQKPGLEGTNVLGLLPGSDPELSDEFIVVGAHYDHVGKNDKGEIWNGADDNASGTAGMLALARVFSKSEPAPRRSILFVAFSGEELGLVGSSWFLADGRIRAEDIAAMVNLDMIGRSMNKSVHAVGTKSSPALRSLVERAAEGLDLQVGFDHEEFFDRSDQASFYYNRIPIVFLNTDEHEDYHKPTDTWDKIDFEDAASITLLAQRIIQTLACMNEPPPFRDGYHRLQEWFGKPIRLAVPFPIPFNQRLDY